MSGRLSILVFGYLSLSPHLPKNFAALQFEFIALVKKRSLKMSS